MKKILKDINLKLESKKNCNYRKNGSGRDISKFVMRFYNLEDGEIK